MDEILAALDNGDRARAFSLLKDYLRRNPRDADGWLAMADAAPAPAMQLDSLRRALSYAPGHARAEEIRARIAGLEAPPTVAPPAIEPLDESSVAAAVTAPEPMPMSAGEAMALSNAMDEPHPDTRTAAEVATETIERSYAGELEELDEPVVAAGGARSYAGELEELDARAPRADAIALDEEFEEEAEEAAAAGSSVWMLLVLAGALLFCIGLFLLLGDLTR